MGTLGYIHDMMRRDKENRELRQRDRERMKETRRRMTECRHTELPPTLSVEKLEEIKKQTQEKEQADQSRAFRIKLIIGVVILAFCCYADSCSEASYTCFSNLPNTKVFSGFQPKRKATTLTYLAFHGQRTAMCFYKIA